MKNHAEAGDTIFFDIYTDTEKAADPAKEDTGLFFFKGNPGEKFAVCNAGGGFAFVGAMHDSFPHALELSKMGYNAFALIYRPGAQTACEDLARAISFIFEHAEELEVDTDCYSLWGGSAGARMADYLGSYGPAAYGGGELPRPGAVIMQYTGHSDYTKNDPPGGLTKVADYVTLYFTNSKGAVGYLPAAPLFFCLERMIDMSKLKVPIGYRPVLPIYETQTAIGSLKRIFEDNLSNALNLRRVSAPLFVEPQTGINDDLNGVERPVEFDIPETKSNAQIVHSLAKWKRMALYKYGFPVGEGIYTDMNAVRRDEEMDNLHSIYVDQWDWEKVIDRDTRTVDYFKETVGKIVGAICDTQDKMKELFPQLKTSLSRDVNFVTTQELEDMYPSLSPKERENIYLEEYKTVCVMQIGDLLKSGVKHDGRAPDYDDWRLNGDIVFWSDVLDCAFEVSSMGIRVDERSLDEQLAKAGCDDRLELPFHKMLLAGELPLTIGGGIGQSRICMLLLEKAHIGEVQVSVWDADTLTGCKYAGIELL